MDGGVGPKNVAEIAAAGCDAVVAGSAVFGQPEPSEVIKEMRRSVQRG